MFWNVTGMIHKDRDLWKELKDWAVISLSVTWMAKKS